MEKLCLLFTTSQLLFVTLIPFLLQIININFLNVLPTPPTSMLKTFVKNLSPMLSFYFVHGIFYHSFLSSVSDFFSLITVKYCKNYISLKQSRISYLILHMINRKIKNYFHRKTFFRLYIFIASFNVNLRFLLNPNSSFLIK